MKVVFEKSVTEIFNCGGKGGNPGPCKLPSSRSKGGKSHTINPLKTATDFAHAYIDLHNEYSEKYKSEFKKIGAKMWNQDKAHAEKKTPERIKHFSERASQGFPYEYPAHPLHVLDSFPHLQGTVKQAQLQKRLGELHSEHLKKFNSLKSKAKKVLAKSYQRYKTQLKKIQEEHKARIAARKKEKT